MLITGVVPSALLTSSQGGRVTEKPYFYKNILILQNYPPAIGPTMSFVKLFS